MTKGKKAKKTDEVRIRLSVGDRVLISRFCPTEADILTQIVVSGIIKKIVFSAKEEGDFVIKRERNTDTSIRTSWKKSKEVTVCFTKAEFELLKSQVHQLDAKKKISQDILSLAIKIRDFVSK